MDDSVTSGPVEKAFLQCLEHQDLRDLLTLDRIRVSTFLIYANNIKYMTKEEECFREIIIFMLLTDELIISKLSHMENQINIKSK